MTAWRGVAQRAAAAAAQLDAPALRAPCRIHAMPVTHMATKGLRRYRIVQGHRMTMLRACHGHAQQLRCRTSRGRHDVLEACERPQDDRVRICIYVKWISSDVL